MQLGFSSFHALAAAASTAVSDLSGLARRKPSHRRHHCCLSSNSATSRASLPACYWSSATLKPTLESRRASDRSDCRILDSDDELLAARWTRSSYEPSHRGVHRLMTYRRP